MARKTDAVAYIGRFVREAFNFHPLYAAVGEYQLPDSHLQLSRKVVESRYVLERFVFLSVMGDLSVLLVRR